MAFLLHRIRTFAVLGWATARPTATVRRLGLVARGWERKRFYKDVSVYRTEGGYGVLLDHRRLRTPGREVMVVPTEPLALAVAGEWGSQGSVLQPSIMHLTALCNTVIDNPQQTTHSAITDSLLSSLTTDTILFRQDEPDDLVAMQTMEWDPVIEWFNHRYSTELQPSWSLEPPSLSLSSLSSLSAYLCELDKWSLEGFWHAVQCSHSVMLTAALMEGHLDLDTTVNLSRLEIRHQVGLWGSVEWQHDVEYHDLRSRLAASHLLARLANWTN